MLKCLHSWRRNRVGSHHTCDVRTAAQHGVGSSKQDSLLPPRSFPSRLSAPAVLVPRRPRPQVLRRFAISNLVAAPCFADEARTRFLGFLDLMDVVAAVVDAARHQGPGTPTAGSGSGGGGSARHRLAARCRSGAAREVAEQPVSAIRATANDAQLVYQAQLGNTLLEVRAGREVDLTLMDGS